MKQENDGTYSETEIAKRREAALKRMLNTPHKPHTPAKKKRAAKAKKSRVGKD